MPAHITDTTQVRGHTLMYTHTQTKTDKRTFKSVNPPPCLRNHNHNHSFFLCILSLRLYFFSRISPLICRNLIFMTNNKTRRLTPSLVPESQMEEEERGARERHRVGDVTKKDGNHQNLNGYQNMQLCLVLCILLSSLQA